jgi:branched-chain amino acid transport system permease protein
MVILGGLGSIWGVVLGASLLSYVNTRLLQSLDTGFVNDKLHSVGLNFTFTEIKFGVFGFILVLVMVMRPEGLLPERRRKLELTEALGDESVYEARA